ncbi:hypothetical protein GCM10010417_24130 [Streptomyces carpaticus]
MAKNVANPPRTSRPRVEPRADIWKKESARAMSAGRDGMGFLGDVVRVTRCATGEFCLPSRPEGFTRCNTMPHRYGIALCGRAQGSRSRACRTRARSSAVASPAW